MSDRMQALAEELQSVRDVRNVREYASPPVLRLDRLVRTFHQGPRKIAVLNGASADILPGQAVALVGPSGAGKSTLLHIAGLLETPDGGHVVINGKDCTGMGDADRTRVRRVQMGFVYQFHQLLPEFSALENVVIPQMILGRSRRVAGQRAAEMLGALGLADRVSHRPAQLSGGEQQRTAIARALANSPRILLADEPTGNLDPSTSALVFRELIELIEHTGVAAVIATHNLQLAKRMHRVLRLEGGLLQETRPADVA
jgi:lipoprotein-releasing system ATP-binding protein